MKMKDSSRITAKDIAMREKTELKRLRIEQSSIKGERVFVAAFAFAWTFLMGILGTWYIPYFATSNEVAEPRHLQSNMRIHYLRESVDAADYQDGRKRLQELEASGWEVAGKWVEDDTIEISLVRR